MVSRKNTVHLDIDPTIMENNLLIADPDAGLGSLFPQDAGPQSKVVNPIPGMCIKLRHADGEHGKVFINLCHTKDIPPPEDIDERRLMELWNANDDTCNYRVPLSIGERREEPDKSGQPADVYDVAVNTVFFGKVETSNIFRMFILDVVMQGLEEKFNIDLEKEDYVIMKNRKAMGTIPGHRVRVKDKAVEGSAPAAPLIQELGTRYIHPPSSSSMSPGPAAAAPSCTGDSDKNTVKPDFRLLKEPASGPARALVAQFQLPSVVTAGEVNLDVGEDRLILTGGKRGVNYHVDFFLPHNVVQKLASARFDASSKILTVNMPVGQAV